MVLRLLHDGDLKYGTILEAVRAMEIAHLAEVGLWDRFVPPDGDQIKTTLAMWYQAMDRSLTQEEVAEIHQEVTRRVRAALPVTIAES